MSRHIEWMGTLLVLLVATPAMAAECAAARAMADGQQKIEQRKEAIQRPEWLLMEFLVSDGTEASRKMFADEIQRSTERTQSMSKLVQDMKDLPDDTPDIPDAGTPACEVITRVHTAVDQLLATREAEIRKYLDGDYPFIRGCDQIGTQLMTLGANKPGSKTTLKGATRAANAALTSQLGAVKMSVADFNSLVGDMLAPSTLPGRTRYAYAAMRCLRNYQGVKILSLGGSSAALARCDTTTWEALGRCIATATASLSR